MSFLEKAHQNLVTKGLIAEEKPETKETTDEMPHEKPEEHQEQELSAPIKRQLVKNAFRKVQF